MQNYGSINDTYLSAINKMHLATPTKNAAKSIDSSKAHTKHHFSLLDILPDLHPARAADVKRQTSQQ